MTIQKQLVEQFLTAYQSLNHNAMAACCHQSARFADIAFRLNGRKQIHAMWHMICENGIEVEVQTVEERGDEVHARVVDTYVFSDTGRPVVNPILCRFQFRDGLIIEHLDECDALEWARQAFGGLKGEIAGRIGFLRRRTARKKIRKFIAMHPEYA
jgi:hypothetical protein